MSESSFARMKANKPVLPKTAATRVAAAATEETVNMHGRTMKGVGALHANLVNATNLKVTSGVDLAGSALQGASIMNSQRLRCSEDASVRALLVREDITGVRNVTCSGTVTAHGLVVGAGGITMDSSPLNMCGGKVEGAGEIALSGKLVGSPSSSLLLGPKIEMHAASGNVAVRGEISAGSVDVAGSVAVAQQIQVGGGLDVAGGVVRVRGAGAVEMASRSLLVGQSLTCDTLVVNGSSASMKNAALAVHDIAVTADAEVMGNINVPSGAVTSLSVRSSSATVDGTLEARQVACAANVEVGGQLIFTGGPGLSGILMNGGPEKARKDILGAGNVGCEALLAEKRVVTQTLAAEAIEMPDDNTSAVQNVQTLTMRANGFAKVHFPRGGSVEGFEHIRPANPPKIEKVDLRARRPNADEMAERFNALVDCLAYLGLIEMS